MAQEIEYARWLMKKQLRDKTFNNKEIKKRAHWKVTRFFVAIKK